MPPRNWWLLGAIGAGVVLMSRSLGATQTVTLNFDPATDDEVDTVVTTGGILTMAQAIAHAEGFYVPGTVPNRANNPGDLKVPGWTGPVTGAEGISVFPSADEGWRRLYFQLDLIRTGRSRVYSPNMTLGAMAARWTDTQQSAWLNNVLDYLVVHGYYDASEDSAVGDLLA